MSTIGGLQRRGGLALFYLQDPKVGLVPLNIVSLCPDHELCLGDGDVKVIHLAMNFVVFFMMLSVRQVRGVLDRYGIGIVPTVLNSPRGDLEYLPPGLRGHPVPYVKAVQRLRGGLNAEEIGELVLNSKEQPRSGPEASRKAREATSQPIAGERADKAGGNPAVIPEQVGAKILLFVVVCTEVEVTMKAVECPLGLILVSARFHMIPLF